MKEKFVAIVAGLIMFAVAVCNAAPGRYDEIPKADVAIGGIPLELLKVTSKEFTGNQMKFRIRKQEFSDELRFFNTATVFSSRSQTIKKNGMFWK